MKDRISKLFDIFAGSCSATSVKTLQLVQTRCMATVWPRELKVRYETREDAESFEDASPFATAYSSTINSTDKSSTSWIVVDGPGREGSNVDRVISPRIPSYEPDVFMYK